MIEIHDPSPIANYRKYAVITNPLRTRTYPIIIYGNQRPKITVSRNNETLTEINLVEYCFMAPPNYKVA